MSNIKEAFAINNQFDIKLLEQTIEEKIADLIRINRIAIENIDNLLKKINKNNGLRNGGNI